MTVLGLTGTFGSGKSTVASMFESLGAVIIDADQIAKEVVAPGSCALEEIVERFGEGVLSSDGSLDRKKTAHIVFGDSKKLQELNRIIHPRVREKELALLDQYRDRSLVVLMVPLLLENRMESLVDKVAVVTISDANRLERLRKRDNISEERVGQVLSNQWSQEKKVANADFIIDNDGALEETERQVREVVRRVAPTLLKQ